MLFKHKITCKKNTITVTQNVQVQGQRAQVRRKGIANFVLTQLRFVATIQLRTAMIEAFSIEVITAAMLEV